MFRINPLEMKNWNFLGLGKAATILLGVGLFCLGTVKAQVVAESSVPANTVKSFKAASQGGSAIWMVGPNKSYEAAWMKDGQNLVYVFDQAGQLQQKKYHAGIKSMPEGVGEMIAAAYPSGKVDASYRVITRTNQKFYEVQVAGAQSVDRMRFDLAGKPMGKTTVSTSVAATPEKSQPIASNTPVPVKQQQEMPVAMRGESANTSSNTVSVDADLLDDDLGDLLEDDEDLGDLLDDDDNWEDINLDDELEDDDDLLDIGDDLDDLDFDMEESEDGDGF